MKSRLNYSGLLLLSIWLSIIFMSCDTVDTPQNHLDIKWGEYSDPGPDGNPNTFDQDPKNLPQSPLWTYINADGREVQNPTAYPKVPENASAICKNGEYSYSKRRCGTCSQNGGVAVWLKELQNCN